LNRTTTPRIRERMEIIGANPYIMVSAREASQLKRNRRGPMPVRFRVKGRSTRTWRINLMPVGDGRFRLYLNGSIRKESNLRVGDTVDIEAQFDELYRNGPLHPMPVWFADGLSLNPLATLGWNRLAPSRQKEILRYFAQLKSPEAKRRNAQKALHVLAGGPGRFMARPWNEEGRASSQRKQSTEEGRRIPGRRNGPHVR
jgi:Domain of unknown function (DUF1905)/Bacteriocin-protection, YdeI or OmpD-Associated